MSLYLCIFDDNDEEIDGVEVGPYEQYNLLRDNVLFHLENLSSIKLGAYEQFENVREDALAYFLKNQSKCRFPTIVLHSDCDDEWSPYEAEALERELRIIASEFKKLPPIAMTSDWQKAVIEHSGLKFNTLYDCFFDVNGESLFERLIQLAKLCEQHEQSIIFQ